MPKKKIVLAYSGGLDTSVLLSWIKDYILQLIFTKRLCDVFDDEVNRIAMEVGAGKPPTTTFFKN